MMDWVAVGAIATVALVATGIMQARATKASARAVDAERKAPVLPSTPELGYRIEQSNGTYPLRDGWMVDLPDARWVRQQEIAQDLKRFGFCIVRLYNENTFTTQNVALELQASRVWAAQVNSAKIMSPNAVDLKVEAGRITISIVEFPAGEEIKLSATAGGGFFNSISALNAAVKLQNKGLWDA